MVIGLEKSQINYIQDFQLVDQIKWDQAFKRNFNKDNNEQASSKTYTNYAISAGGALFTNMIAGGICNDTNGNIFESFGNYSGGFKGDGLVESLIKMYVLELVESAYC